ncbi:hypothetical protein A2U01_0097678, partial [Trifolium medium]|nr:hypothetical protein [Trifolium medium]
MNTNKDKAEDTVQNPEPETDNKQYNNEHDQRTATQSLRDSKTRFQFALIDQTTRRMDLRCK